MSLVDAVVAPAAVADATFQMVAVPAATLVTVQVLPEAATVATVGSLEMQEYVTVPAPYPGTATPPVMASVGTWLVERTTGSVERLPSLRFWLTSCEEVMPSVGALALPARTQVCQGIVLPNSAFGTSPATVVSAYDNTPAVPGCVAVASPLPDASKPIARISSLVE